MAVMNAQYKHPNSAYSQGLKDLIDVMLKADPQQRPDIHHVSGFSAAIFCGVADERVAVDTGDDRGSLA